ncbi:zinc-binding dehydrogenase [Phytobacter sp. V91]|uniref:zinc-binding dehydrogenase n=1 Tax=Phytobacter sp. V91 TaxID=3369425 RepID=UPI003F5D96AE
MNGTASERGTHRAWVWHGSAEPLQLTCERIDLPALGSHDVLVRNEVIALNPVDWKVLTPGLVNWTPGHVPGVDGAGTVIAVGDEAPQRWLGQRVCYHQSLNRPGSFAEYTPVAHRVLMSVPDALDFATAASFPCPGLTAWQALEKLPPRQAAPLLISGAGGAVGHYLVQFAVAAGFSVTAMCNARHWDRLRDMGVNRCIPGALAAGATLPESEVNRFYGVIDSVDEEHATRLTPALMANGHIVSIQGRLEHWPNAPFGRTLSLHEVALGALHAFGDDEAWQRLTRTGEQKLIALANQQLKPMDRVMDDFSRLPQLLEGLRHRQFSGKPLILVNPD